MGISRTGITQRGMGSVNHLGPIPVEHLGPVPINPKPRVNVLPGFTGEPAATASRKNSGAVSKMASQKVYVGSIYMYNNWRVIEETPAIGGRVNLMVTKGKNVAMIYGARPTSVMIRLPDTDYYS